MHPSILLSGSGDPYASVAAARARRPSLASRCCRVKLEEQQPATGDGAVSSEQRLGGNTYMREHPP